MGCTHCSAIIKGPEINHPNKGYPIMTRGYYTCNSEGVIYLLKCHCGKGYVGQTSRSIKIRLNEHKSNIRTYHLKKQEYDTKQNKEQKGKFGESTVARHYFKWRHNTSEVRWQILEQMTDGNSANRRTALLKRESYWIHKLGTVAPGGLNKNMNMSIFLWIWSLDSLPLSFRNYWCISVVSGP